MNTEVTSGKPRRMLPRRGLVIRPFDPWSSPLCTCPVKYSLNPYTGCSHFCTYCYATSYIGRRPSTPKKDIIEKVLADLKKLDPRFHIDMSTSSDPYPPEEERFKITHKILSMIGPLGYRVLIITKGSLVARDVDIISQSNVAVTITITTIERDIARRLEVGAPLPEERLSAMRRLSEAGVPVGLRLDPILPYLTDDEKMIRELLEAAREAGSQFVVTSVYKARPDNLRRVTKAFPELTSRYEVIYKKEGRWMHGYWYAPANLRRRILELVRREAVKLGMEFATCREGFPDMNTAPTCDGSHLIPSRISPKLALQARVSNYLYD